MGKNELRMQLGEGGFSHMCLLHETHLCEQKNHLKRALVSSKRSMVQIDADIKKNGKVIQSLKNELLADIEAVNQSLTHSVTEIDIQLQQKKE